MILIYLAWRAMLLGLSLPVGAAFLTVAAAVWLCVFLFGLLAPGWSPRRAGDAFLAFIHECVAQVLALRRR